jgi:mono/diheme cytochrome c family protein
MRSSVLIAITPALLAACTERMDDQPRYEPLEQSAFFADGRSARPIVKGTVPRGRWFENEAVATGRSGGRLVDAIPVPLTAALVERGRERFNIHCSPCHDRAGTGQGIVVKRGYKQPPSYHEERLRLAPAGHFFSVMTEGFGVMPDYASEVAIPDRWAITAYIRALQLSQHARIEDVPEDVRQSLRSGGPR